MGRHFFISDLHLGANYIADAHAHQRRVMAFLDSIKDEADSLFLMGDIIDYWFEYRKVVPRGYVRFFGKLAELSDAGVDIHWFTGNHDVWLRDYVRDEIGLTVHHQAEVLSLDGVNLFLAHGDDVGRQPFTYRVLRWCFHNPVCQWLYAAVHPRWTTAIAIGWSEKNRTSRKRDQELKSQPSAFARLQDFAHEYRQRHPEVDGFVFGHLHLAKQVDLGGGVGMTCLGDWLRQDTYAVLDDGTLSLHHFPEE